MVTINLPDRIFIPCSKDKSPEPQGVWFETAKLPVEMVIRTLFHGAAAKGNDAHSSLTKESEGYSIANCVAMMQKAFDNLEQGVWAERGKGAGSAPIDPLTAMIEKVTKEWMTRDYGTSYQHKKEWGYKGTPAQRDKLEELCNRKGWLHASAAEKAQAFTNIAELMVKLPAVIKEAKRRLESAPELPDLL